MLISLGDTCFIILTYANAIDLMNIACVNRLLMKNSNDEKLWKSLCELNDIKQTSTRIRNIKLWKLLYLSNLCNECKNDSINGNGLIKVDVNGGSTNRFHNYVIILCGNCFNEVRSIPMKDRKLSTCKLLPNLKKKLFKSCNYSLLILKIPEFKSKVSKAEKYDNKYDNPNINNTLLRLIKRK